MNLVKYEDHQLRTIEIEGEPWLVAADVCRILGLRNVTMALAPLAADEATSFNRIEHGFDSGAPMRAINECGLYRLTMRSDKADARVFQDWVVREVLPSIRRSGGYLLNEHARETAHADTKEAMPNNPHSRRYQPPAPQSILPRPARLPYATLQAAQQGDLNRRNSNLTGGPP